MREDTFNKPPESTSLAWLHTLNGVLLLALWGFAVGAYSGLPDLVPGHIGPGGVTRWDAKDSSPWFIGPIIAVFSAAMMYGLATAASNGGTGMNMPDKDRFRKLPPAGQRYAIQPMRGFMFGLATWLLALMLYMQWEMYSIAHAGPDAPAQGSRLLWVTAAMTAFVVAGAIYSGLRVKRRIREWEVVGATALIALMLAACGTGTPAASTGNTLDSGSVLDRGDSWEAAAAAGHGTARVLYVPAGGFAYRDDEGTLTGVTVDMMRQFAAWVQEAKGVRVDLEFVEEQDWRTFYSRVREGGTGLFGIGNVTITQARRSELQFSPAYLTNVAVLITRDDVPELTSPAAAATAFSGLDALAFEGTLHETRLRALRDEYLPDASVAMASTNDEILDRVAEGGWFAYIDAYNYWRARDGGAPLRRHPVADDPAEEFGVIMPLQSDWGPVMEAFFEADGGYRNTPEYRDLLIRHLGEPLTRALEAARLGQPAGT